jgi:hypothetical protein
MFQELTLDAEKEVKKKISVAEIMRLRVFPSDEIPKPEVVLFFHDKMVMTRKNISCITGKAKVGKTFLMTLLNMIVLHKGDFQNVISSYLPKGKDKIIYIDTEQSDYHILLILKRIKDVVKENKIENLLMFNFDALDTEQRKDYTRELIYETKDCGLVVIDGIADLIYDTNDIRESSLMVSELRKWSVENDLHICNVIHQNPSQSDKMRGHLGTILTNKSETVIQISSSKENESVKLVETLATRNKKPDNWSFEIIEGVPTIMNECYSEPKSGRPKTKQLNDIERYSLLLSIYSDSDKIHGISTVVLLEKLKESHIKTFGNIGVNALDSLFKYCKEMNWLVADGHKKPYLLYPFTNDL